MPDGNPALADAWLSGAAPDCTAVVGKVLPETGAVDIA